MQTTLKFDLNMGDEISTLPSRVKSRVEILRLIEKNPVITTQELADAIGLTIKAIEKQLKILRVNGKLRHMGAKKRGHWEVIK